MMEAESAPGKKGAVEKEIAKFSYQFSSNGTRYHLRVPVRGPLNAVRARELASRLVRAHNLPCYLEDELCSQLEEFTRDAALRQCDEEGDKLVKLAGDSVAVEGSEVAKRIDKCVEQYTKNCSEFSVATVTSDTDGPTFSDMYHTLIHSPALETLLQLEHTYTIAMENSLQAWKNARELTTRRHEQEKKALISSSWGTEEGMAAMVAEQESDRAVLEAQWRGELRKLRNTQRHSYQQWIDEAYKEMTSSDQSKNSRPVRNKRMGSESGDDVFSGMGEGGEVEEEGHDSTLEESFTIHLGAQLKSTHNIRLLCGNPLSLCRQRRAGLHGGIMASPERLQTAMSLYSMKLSCMIVMVDRDIGQPGGMERKFADICHQSTDFHFPDYSDQLLAVKESAARANENRKSGGQQIESSYSSQTSEPSTPGGGSPLHHTHKATRSFTDSDSSVSLSVSSPPPSTATLSGGSRRAGSEAGWGGRRGGEGGRYDGEDVAGSSFSEHDAHSVMLEPGDFFLTRHSNLSQVHIVFHLATDTQAVRDVGLRARHPVMTGLKNCLYVAARNSVHHITVPLLLVHHMEPEMTITWCLRRAELVFKCVKGFMLENPLWGNGDSRTIQFLIPQGISHDLFEEFCGMLPKIFRVSTTRKLTSRNRTHSYK